MTAHDAKKLLGVDIDNVVAITDPAIRKSIWDLYSIWLDQEQIVHYDYSRCGITREQEQRVLEYFREVTCSELDVLPGAVEALELLRISYRVVLVTSRNPLIIGKTRDWLRTNDIPHNSLVFDNAKHQSGHAFDFFVEDHGETALSLAEKGIQTFLFDYPWNHYIGYHPKIKRVSGWQDVLAELI